MSPDQPGKEWPAMETGVARVCYSAAEVAEKLGINIKGVYDGMRAGEIPSIKVGRRFLVPKARFDRMLDAPDGGTEAGDRAP